MRAEYLIFNAAVILPPLALSTFRRTYFLDRWAKALVAAVVCALPFLTWDVLVAGVHWHFNPSYVLGHTIAGLPFEEVLFFVSVPLACTFTWDVLVGGRNARCDERLIWAYLPLGLTAPAGLILFAQGTQYSGLTLLVLSTVAVCDYFLGPRMMMRPRFHLLLALVALMTGLFNGYLTGRPVVLYDESYITAIRIGTVPIEDFFYGAALVTANVTAFHILDGRDRAKS